MAHSLNNNNILDEYAPLKSVISKFSTCPILWMTPELLQAIKEKNKGKRCRAKTNSAVDITLCKQFKRLPSIRLSYTI